jgi:DNA mismatch repair protein MutS
MAKKAQLSPLMEQYKRLKNQYPDAILLCRVGDFYEAFFDDAELIARELEIVLTSRDKDKATPMAGIPHHALDSYLYKLVNGGHKVAILEQIEDAKNVPAGELVKRDIVRIVTPGTLTDPKVLNQRMNNYLVAVCVLKGVYGLAFVDLSTGEFAVTELECLEKLWTELHRLAPKELLFSEAFDDPEMLERIQVDLKAAVNTLPDWRFALDTTRSELLQHFNTLSLDGFGCEHLPAAICAAGALIYYLHETQKQEVEHILSIHTYTVSDFMILDADTQRNLELTTSIRDGSSKGTLLETIDQTVTPMGARKLRGCLLQPLLQPDQINARLNAVEELKNQIGTQEEIRDLLNKMYDMERLISRISLGSANARDLLALKDSLHLIPAIKVQLQDCETSLLKTLNETLDPLDQLANLIESATHPEPPVTLREGGLIRDGYSEQLDELRAITSRGKSWIAELQQLEREKTGITSLKIGFNQVFGYYIEVTRSNLHLVPDDYIRKQTLTNAERFITPELKEREAQILNAQDQIQALEYNLFFEIRTQIGQETERIQQTAAVIGMIDVIANLAYIASKHDYAKPIIDEKSDEIIIRNGRHPVVERLFTQEGFVPNDTALNCRDGQMHIITGPNMSGKCVRGDTLVFTDAGLAPIASLQPGKVAVDTFAPVSYRVKGLNGDAHATHFYVGGRRRTVRIRTKLGYELEGTPEHRIWVRRRCGTEDWKPLGEIESSDSVAIDCQIDLWGNCETLETPGAASMQSQVNRLGAPRDSTPRSMPPRLTPDLAYAMGLLVGDGVLTERKALSLVTRDSFLRREFRRIMQAEFGYCTEPTTKSRHSNDRVSDLQIRLFFEALGLRYAAAVRVPPAILRAPKTIVSAFLQGLFDTTSDVDAKGNITLFTPSLLLAKQVHTLLLNFGVVSSLQEKKASHTGNWNYRISIGGVDALTFCGQIGIRHPRKRNDAKHIHLIGYSGHSDVECSERQTSANGRYVYDSIVDITPGAAEVFDLSVEESHSFVANGFVNHNSTYLRQTALITLFAQMGSFVPASAAKIGIVDRIFTRVGASDNLVMGQSTFLVEMNETANILNNATPRSLIILDEIGRGTSTFDGLSIAWAVAEYILDKKKIGGKTLFATHYHELIELAGKYKHVKNYNVAVHEDGEKITFLRKVVEGGTDQSYGIHVARLAGLPLAVIARAQQILEILEQHNLSVEGDASDRLPKAAPKAPRPRRRLSQSAFQDDSLQLALFTPKTHPIVEELQNLDLNQLTPMGALNLLYQLKAKADE